MAPKKKIDWNKRIGNGEKGTSDYVNPALAWGLFGGVFALAVAIGLIVILPLV